MITLRIKSANATRNKISIRNSHIMWAVFMAQSPLQHKYLLFPVPGQWVSEGCIILLLSAAILFKFSNVVDENAWHKNTHILYFVSSIHVYLMPCFFHSRSCQSRYSTCLSAWELQVRAGYIIYDSMIFDLGLMVIHLTASPAQVFSLSNLLPWEICL